MYREPKEDTRDFCEDRAMPRLRDSGDKLCQEDGAWALARRKWVAFFAIRFWIFHFKGSLKISWVLELCMQAP